MSRTTATAATTTHPHNSYQHWTEIGRTSQKLQRPGPDGDIIIREASKHQSTVLRHGSGMRSHQVHEAHQSLRWFGHGDDTQTRAQRRQRRQAQGIRSRKAQHRSTNEVIFRGGVWSVQGDNRGYSWSWGESGNNEASGNSREPTTDSNDGNNDRTYQQQQQR